MAPPSAVSLGSCVAGIPVTLHYSFFLLLVIEFANAIRYREYPMYMLFVVVLYGPVLLLTIVIHEFGHALTTKRMGGEVGGIVLWPLGGFAICGPVEGLKGDLKVALMGPATHVPQGLVWWIIYVAVTGGNSCGRRGRSIWMCSRAVPRFFQVLAAEAFYLNLILLIFNLFIPAYPLDGGRIYAASLILVFKLKSLLAAKVTAVTALLISTGMILYAIIGFITNTGGSALLLGLVGAIIFYQSYELWAAARRDDLANHPIFGRECYKEGGGGDAQAEGEVPAQTDEAVMA
ncbi:hypothetical protein ACHAXT_001906 [Thalassiosira profunda]